MALQPTSCPLDLLSMLDPENKYLKTLDATASWPYLRCSLVNTQEPQGFQAPFQLKSKWNRDISWWGDSDFLHPGTDVPIFGGIT